MHKEGSDRRQEKTRHQNAVLFLFWYVIERFLLLCSAIYKAWGMLLPKEKSIYELEFIRKSFLGKMNSRNPAIATFLNYTKQKGSFPIGKPPLVCTHII